MRLETRDRESLSPRTNQIVNARLLCDIFITPSISAHRSDFTGLCNSVQALTSSHSPITTHPLRSVASLRQNRKISTPQIIHLYELNIECDYCYVRIKNSSLFESNETHDALSHSAATFKSYNNAIENNNDKKIIHNSRMPFCNGAASISYVNK